ncbi:MAG TPA: hypothetical protein VN516_10650 [Candidatus Baltobacteraceae bacterium]|nr:hypothetical protein [Candidatus Baltobacteraceae bacterium]
MKIFGSLIAVFLIVTSPVDEGVGALLGFGMLAAIWGVNWNKK